MIDHLSAAVRFSEARARIARTDGETRTPIRSILPAITGCIQGFRRKPQER